MTSFDSGVYIREVKTDKVNVLLHVVQGVCNLWLNSSLEVLSPLLTSCAMCFVALRIGVV